MATLSAISAEWLQKVTRFRRHPAYFLEQKGLNEAAFVMDIQKELYDEELTHNLKIHLLLILQEYSSLLLPNKDSIEQCIGPLMDIYRQASSSSPALYRAQYLVTVTSIILERDILDDYPTLFCRFVDLLLELVAQVNSLENAIVRAAACSCLEEMETHYPTLLFKKLPNLYSLSQLEKTLALQAYISLTVTTLRNGLHRICTNDCGSNAINDVIILQTESLKSLQLAVEKYEMIQHTKTERFPPNTDVGEMKRMVSFILSQTGLMTSPCHLHILLGLLEIVEMIPHFSPVIFKSMLIGRFMTTANLSVFYVLLRFLFVFGDTLFNDKERLEMARRLVSSAVQPALNSAHRLLIYEWLLRFPDKNNHIPDSDSLPPGLDFTTHKALFPTVFDGIDTKLKKLNVLSLYYIPGAMPDAASATLSGCLFCLHQPMHYGVRGKGVANFFRALYMVYTRHSRSCLVGEMEKLLFRLSTEQPMFTPNILDFVQAISADDPRCHLSGEVLSLLANEIVSTPVENLMSNLLHHLMVLETAAHDGRIYPKTWKMTKILTDFHRQQPIVRFLQNLLESSDLCRKGDWRAGNSVLAILRTILQTHEIGDVCATMGDLLHLMAKSFKSTDIRDRALFLDNLLTNMSSEKNSTIFADRLYRRMKSAQSLTDSASFPSANERTMKKLGRPVIRLESVTHVSEEEKVKVDPPNSDVTSEQLVQNYNNYLEHPNFDTSFQKTYKVVLEKDFERIFAVEIEFVNKNDDYDDIVTIVLPYVSQRRSQEITVKFKPNKPSTGFFGVRAIYTSMDAVSVVSDLAPLVISFSDLFHHLPYPEPLSPCAKLRLFDSLWQKYRNNAENAGKTGSECLTSFQRIEDVPRETLLEKLKTKNLHQFYIPDSGNAVDEDKFAMFLPPSTTLLLRFTYPNNESFVRVATDQWRIAHELYQFLKSLYQES